MPKTVSEETERLKRHWEREAPTYDRRMGFFERVLFGDGREWVCSRASGEVLEVAVGTGRNFPLGQTTVSCTATDSRGNSDTQTFSVIVKDTTPPTISGIPAAITARATSSAGAQVTYGAPTATDLVDGSVNVNCQPASGSTFAL